MEVEPAPLPQRENDGWFSVFPKRTLSTIDRWKVPVWLMFCSSIGLFLRIGLLELSFQSFSSSKDQFLISSVIGGTYFFPNIVGCWIMGSFVSLRSTKPDHDVESINTTVDPMISAELYQAITTGTCGALTTFSSWMVFVALLFHASDFLTGAIAILGGYATSYCAFRAGIHAGEWLSSHYHDLHLTLPSIWIGSGLLLLSQLVFVSGLVVMKDAQATRYCAAGILAPWGSLCRYTLSLGNQDGRSSDRMFPYLYTLIANTSACIALACVIQYAPKSDYDSQVWLEGGLEIGFLGCLSTVSSWMQELSILTQAKRKTRAYMYGSLSLALDISLAYLIFQFG